MNLMSHSQHIIVIKASKNKVAQTCLDMCLLVNNRGSPMFVVSSDAEMPGNADGRMQECAGR